MTHKTLNSRHALKSCTLQLHSWNPFNLHQTLKKTLESSDVHPPKPYSLSKKPCLSNRTTAPPITVDNLDITKMTLFEDQNPPQGGTLRWIARKRRRRGSRSVSGRSSDNSGTRRCCSLAGAPASYATDFPILGTDSSGELFVNGDANWALDVGEEKNVRRDLKDVGGVERENLGNGGFFDVMGNESGYGSEAGYRGDVEFGYGDEFDEEGDDERVLFWGDMFGDRMEIIGESTFSDKKTQHRCRRKKHDWQTVYPP
ncbi:uncharacterized protein LOC143852829 isoform X2 [Tasmannia lanceolata]|uniref:uncharacterized protein LOC143852829 isoform X2 n=1 Tax=Tasmannia lanceolata TaxID=3420 RepID=UPI0040639AEF